MTAIERARAYRIEQIESLDYRARRQDIYFQRATGHVVHLLGEVEGEFVEDVLCGPGALEAPGNGLLCSDDLRGRKRSSPDNSCRAGFQELSARAFFGSPILTRASSADFRHVAISSIALNI
jgi:hypothetical protein